MHRRKVTRALLAILMACTGGCATLHDFWQARASDWVCEDHTLSCTCKGDPRLGIDCLQPTNPCDPMLFGPGCPGPNGRPPVSSFTQRAYAGIIEKPSS